MTIRAYRLAKSSRISTAFDGEGAWRYGGRWNSLGVRIVYTSGTLSLAMLEIMVHLEDYSVLCKDYSYVAIEIPMELITTVDVRELPPQWSSGPPGTASQNVGDTWVLEQRSAVLSVPTVLVPEERNYLLNPQHPDFSRIATGKPQRLCFDRRFIKQ